MTLTGQNRALQRENLNISVQITEYTCLYIRIYIYTHATSHTHTCSRVHKKLLKRWTDERIKKKKKEEDGTFSCTEEKAVLRKNTKMTV